MLQLVGLWDSPFVRRVVITLRIYEMAFEPLFLSVYRNAEQLRQINPQCTAPSLLLESGEVLIDSHAIIDYLDELAGRERALMPASGQARRQTLQWIAKASAVCDKVGHLYRELGWRPPEKHYEVAITRFRQQIADGLLLLENEMPHQGQWLLGADLTHADVAVAVMLRFVQYYDASLQCLPAQALPKLQALSSRCEALPAFALTPLE